MLVKAGSGALTGGRPDALLLGGDIGDSADTEEQILTVHRLAHEIAAGEIPVVYARGNHDTRGALAEKLGVSRSAIGNYETGVSTPKEDVLLRLFDALRGRGQTGRLPRVRRRCRLSRLPPGADRLSARACGA